MDVDDERIREIVRGDIHNEIYRKLRKWVVDAMQLCDLAELPQGETIMLALMKVVIRTLAAAMPKDKFMTMMDAAYDCATLDNERDKHAKDR